MRWGRRSAYLGEENHYGHKGASEALGVATAADRLLRDGFPKAQHIKLFGEVYGGQYGPQCAEGQTRRPVQVGVWYTSQVCLAFFDVWVDGAFLPVTDAATVCEMARVPFLRPAFKGGYEAVCAWARMHAGDVATAYWNPEGLPPLEDNAGEGFVVRPLGVDANIAPQHMRAMFKVKSPKFREMHEVRTPVGAVPKGACTCLPRVQALGEACIVPARVQSVLSKHGEMELTKENAYRLGAAVVADVKADCPDEWVNQHDGGCNGKKCSGFMHAFAHKAVLAELARRGAFVGTGVNVYNSFQTQNYNYCRSRQGDHCNCNCGINIACFSCLRVHVHVRTLSLALAAANPITSI